MDPGTTTAGCSEKGHCSASRKIILTRRKRGVVAGDVDAIRKLHLHFICKLKRSHESFDVVESVGPAPENPQMQIDFCGCRQLHPSNHLRVNLSAKEKIILAIDTPDATSAIRLMDSLAGELVWAKIGLQLFTAEGPAILAAARSRGLKIFLDLKFHDIPNTVLHAVASARSLGAEMTTIHLAGGSQMVQSALAEAGEMLVLGVTVLTSMDEAALAETSVGLTPAGQVLALARMGVRAGLRGVVASPQEITPLRETLGPELTIVTPGVRPQGTDPGDQKRVATPAEAIRRGANYVVIGRPISGDSNPRSAFLKIAGEIDAA